METLTQYEVRCPRCDVSFPTGTKRCIHCGGRTGPAEIHIGLSQASEASTQGGHDIVLRPVEHGRPAAIGEEEDEQEGGRPGLMRSAVTLVWVLLAIAFSVIRACSEN